MEEKSSVSIHSKARALERGKVLHVRDKEVG